MKKILNLILSLGGILGLGAEAKLIQDGQATAAAPTDANIALDIQDAVVVFEKYFPNIPAAKVQAVENVLDCAIPLKDSRSTQNVEVFVGSLIVNAPAFGVKDAPLTADVQAQLAACTSTLQAWAIITKAALAVEGVA
jgi:hypothetical protein